MYFRDFIGQEEIKQYLIKSIRENNISHGYIFEGPNGTNKLDMALLFAQALLCKSFTNEPCNTCDSCIKINTSNHPDVHILSSDEKSIKKDNIDELIQSIAQKPYESDKKIYIIEDSDTMTLQAANSFLKTLEEPMGNSVIILLTENTNLLLPTITSRCQILKFKGIKEEQIIKYLADKYKLQYNEASLIANYSEGIIARADNIVNKADDILQKREEIIKIFDKIITSDKNVIYELEEYFEQNKDNIDEFIKIIILWIRDIYLYRYKVEDLIVNNDLIHLLQKHSNIVSIKDIDKLMLYLQNVVIDVNNNINYKLIIDNLVIRLQEEKIND